MAIAAAAAAAGMPIQIYGYFPCNTEMEDNSDMDMDQDREADHCPTPTTVRRLISTHPRSSRHRILYHRHAQSQRRCAYKKQSRSINDTQGACETGGGDGGWDSAVEAE